MRPHGETFLDAIATARAILCSEARRDGYYRDAMQQAVVADPGEEQPPTGIADTFCQSVILDQTGNLEVFVGNEIARFHQRTRSLGCKVITPPLDLQIPFCQAFDRLFAVLGTFLGARDPPV